MQKKRNFRTLGPMKKLLCLLSFAALLAVSCEKEQETQSLRNHHRFSVNAIMDDIQEDQLTKATGKSVMRLTWSEGDKVSVVNVTTGKALGGDLTAVADGSSSIFSGELTGEINANDKLAFIYPSQNYTAEQTFVPVEIDYSVQNGTSPDLIVLAHYTVPSAANSFENVTVTFQYLMSFMRLNMSQLPVSTTISSVTINNVNDHLQLSISGGEMVSTASSVNNCIKFTTSGKTDARGTRSILVGILPTLSTTSRSISAETASNTYSAYFSNAKLNVGTSYYSSITGFVQSLLTFKDASVKAKCVEMFDQNADGHLSFLEAAAVTDLGVATKAAGGNPFPTSILHFAELQFFTGLASIPSFQNYTMLKTVAIPPQITSLPAYAFNGCSALETVIFTSTTPPSISSTAFTGCDSNLALYVPTESLSAYKTALPSLSDKIHDISEVGSDFGLEGWSEVEHNGSV